MFKVLSDVDAKFNVVGIASTGALSSNYERRGDNQSFLSVFDGERLYRRHVHFLKGR